MTEVNPTAWTDLLSKSGPFALLALLLAGVVYTFTLLRKASGANRKTFARFLAFEAAFGVVLTGFAMFVWYRLNVSSANIITGTIEGLTDELVVSKDLFLRPELANTYEWKLITIYKHKDGDTVDVIVMTPGQMLPPHHLITVKSAYYDPNAIVKLVWRRDDGRVFYRGESEPLPVASAAPAWRDDLARIWFPGLSVLLAQMAPRAESVASANPVVREAAIRELAHGGARSIDAIKKLLQDPNPSTEAAAIVALNLMDAPNKKTISDGKLLGDAANVVVRAMASEQSGVRQEALRCITWYDRSRVPATASTLSKSASVNDRAAAARILQTYGKEDALPILNTARASEKDPTVQRQLDGALNGVSNAVRVGDTADFLSHLPPGRRKSAIELAFNLKDKRVPFKWGGRSETEGFDSSGFAAYVLSKVGMLSNPEKSYSSLLRKTFERPPNPQSTDPQVGDLVFYDLGYVTFFLGSNTCIGMLPSGILVQPVDFGPKRLGYGYVPY